MSKSLTTKKPEVFFVFVIVIFGTLLVFGTPFGAGWDEDTHIGRIWEMSSGVLIPNQFLSTGPNYPSVFYEISYRQDLNLNPVGWEKWKQQVASKIDWANFINHRTRARYFPTLYLVQASIMGVMGRVFDLPVGIIYFTLRFSYLFLYAILVYLSIRIVPIGKWILGLASILPMSLIQAASVSPDSLNNGLAFLFIAWVLYLNSPHKKATFSKTDWAITAFLTLSICTLKINSIPLLLILFMIPKAKFGSIKWKFAFIVFSIISFLLVSLGWNILTASQLLYAPTIDTYVVSDQLKGVVSNPLGFIKAILTSILWNSPVYLRDLIGVGGYYYWKLPLFIYWIVPVGFIFAILRESTHVLIDRRKKIQLLSIGVIVFLLTIILFYLLYNPPGTSQIPGVHGRYFLFISPLMLIALCPKEAKLRFNNLWLQIGTCVILGFSAGSMFLSYHIPCGDSFYKLGGCILPRYKNWSPETSLEVMLTRDVDVQQTFQADCTNLDQVSIWVKDKGEVQSPLLVIIQDKATEEILRRISVSAQQIPSSGWLRMDMKPLPGSISNQYILTARSTGTITGSGIKLGYTSHNEYTGGNLTLNSFPQEGDLLFVYGCPGPWSTIFQ